MNQVDYCNQWTATTVKVYNYYTKAKCACVKFKGDEPGKVFVVRKGHWRERERDSDVERDTPTSSLRWGTNSTWEVYMTGGDGCLPCPWLHAHVSRI